MAKIKFCILGMFVWFSVSCTHALHEYYAGDEEVVLRGETSTRVTSKAEQYVVMGFVEDTNYVDQAFTELQEKCPNGVVTGIHTRYSTSHGFFSWTNKVKMMGNCITH